jgi:two-component system, repressor protein LuxO
MFGKLPIRMGGALEMPDDGSFGNGKVANDRAAVLLVEDMPSLSRLYVEYLKKAAVTVEAVETGAAALAALDRTRFQIVLLDLKLPDMDGMEVLRRIKEMEIPVGVVVITANGSINVAVEAMRAGAYDFLVKPFSAARLIVTIRNTIERFRLRRIVQTWRDDLARDRYYGFIGSSLPMQAVYRIIDAAAASKATVFITGESGTGKEVCAEAIHRRSPRKEKPFVALNCAAIPHDLIESEIFGHVKGAFTGAVAEHEGAAARADGGTLFLDEICELALDLQTKLLRFVQTGAVQKVGGTKNQPVDLRIVCATNRDPLVEVREGRLREDLYYRLHVIPVHLPPLREREEDVVRIARHFLREYAAEEGKRFVGFEAGAEAELRRYNWPGNVRQLQNVIRNIVVLHDGERVTTEMLPPPLATGAGGETEAPARQQAAAKGGPTRILPLWEVEKSAIEAAIEACDGHIPRAAAMLGISASTIYRKRVAWEAETRV